MNVILNENKVKKNYYSTIEFLNYFQAKIEILLETTTISNLCLLTLKRRANNGNIHPFLEFLTISN